MIELFLSVAISTIILLAFTWIILRILLVEPIMNRIYFTEDVTERIMNDFCVNSQNCPYLEYITRSHQTYEEIYKLHEKALQFLWSNNSALVSLLMSRSEKNKCKSFIDTTYQYQEKTAKYRQFVFCSNYNM